MAPGRPDVCYKYDSAAGGEIRITLPQGVDRRRAVDICDAVEAAVAAALLEKASQVRHGAEAAKEQPAAEESRSEKVREWPSCGTVSVREIVDFWNIGRSSFRARVRSGEFAPALECPGRAPNAPKVWDALTIGRDLAACGYTRRGA